MTEKLLIVMQRITNKTLVFKLILHRIPVVSMYLQAVWKSVDPDQLASQDLHCFQNGYYKGLDVRKLVFGVCEQQTHRLACADV